MKFLPVLFFLVVSFSSCSKKEKRKDVLPVKEMSDVMWDLVRADQYVSSLILKDSTRNKKDESVKLYDQIFHIHKITSAQFKTSYNYYTSRPDLFRPILDSLAKRKVEPSLLRPAHSINKDSLIKQTFRKRPQK